LTLSRLVLDIQGNSSAVTLPLGIIVTTLLDAAAEDVAVRILGDAFDTRVQRTYIVLAVQFGDDSISFTLLNIILVRVLVEQRRLYHQCFNDVQVVTV